MLQSLRSDRITKTKLIMRRAFVSTHASNLVVVKNSLVNCSNEKKLDGRYAFTPGRDISWYSCGPTVYDDAHIGHGRTYVFTDIIRRILADYHGCNVNFAMGITDIDDKIIDRAQRQGKKEWAEMLLMVRDLENDFFRDMDKLNVRRPDAVLRVTEHIEEIVQYIDTLEKSGRAYSASDGVYFSVPACGEKYIKFLELSNESSSDPVQQSSATASDIVTQAIPSLQDNNENNGLSKGVKKDKRDFALWKTVKPGEPSWPSPWGDGRPGWHIECSAMTHSFFGSNIDIHSGGVDLKFPHHTNEIAQSEAYNACCSHSHTSHHDQGDWVNCWMHTGHLYIEGRKMSKSLKNFITIRGYLEGGYSSHPALDFRIFCLQHKYHSSVHFSQDRIDDAGIFRRKIETFLRNTRAINSLREASSTASSSSGSPGTMTRKPTAASRKLLESLRSCREGVHAALSNDFDTPEVLRLLNNLVGEAMQYSTLVVATAAAAKDDDRTINDGPRDNNYHNNNQPIEPLLAVADYVVHVLDIFGVAIASKAAGGGGGGEAATGLDAGSVGGVNASAAMDALVAFRTRVRNASLKGMKGMKGIKLPPKKQQQHASTSSAELTTEGTSSDSSEARALEAAAAAAKDALGEVMKACDWVRDTAAPTAGVKIEDVSSDLSTWRPEKQP